jgi:hypothetical protein
VSRPPRVVREDVHIHASQAEVQALIGEPLRWRPPSFTEIEGGVEQFAFRLLLPLRAEYARLLRRETDDGSEITFATAEGAALRAFTWVINSEAAREVHLVAEIVYEPARGPVGWLLEELLHRPGRRQALRDALWQVKLLAEGRE